MRERRLANGSWIIAPEDSVGFCVHFDARKQRLQIEMKGFNADNHAVRFFFEDIELWDMADQMKFCDALKARGVKHFYPFITGGSDFSAVMWRTNKHRVIGQSRWNRSQLIKLMKWMLPDFDVGAFS